MIPAFQANGNLPPGIHVTNWQELWQRLGWNPHRRGLLAGFRAALNSLASAGCHYAYLGGSVVTKKYRPEDFDGCWEADGVDWARLDPELRQFSSRRLAQKQRYGGELFPVDSKAYPPNTAMIQFFQLDRDGSPKGILGLDPGPI